MKFFRLGLILLGAAGAGLLAFTFAVNILAFLYQALPNVSEAANSPGAQAGLTLAAIIVGAGAGGAVYQGVVRGVGRWDDLDSGEKANVFIGITFGVITTVPFMVNFNQQGIATGTVLSVVLMIFLSGVAIFALRSMEDVLPWSKQFGRGRHTGIKVLDTSVIIDGRVLDVVGAGFMEGPIYVPKFVLHELQYIADHSDGLRRQRGKRGLEVLRGLQEKIQIDLGSQDRLAAEGSDGVDGRLVRLARALGADLVTNDHNLNRVAQIQDVRVLNLNDLSLALRPNVLPGEILEVLVQREGSQPGQGVAYLDDGTMVVVENGRRAIGEEVTVVVAQVHQTERGKMIFAELPDAEEEASEPGRRRRPARPARPE